MPFRFPQLVVHWFSGLEIGPPGPLTPLVGLLYTFTHFEPNPALQQGGSTIQVRIVQKAWQFPFEV